jgi:hypothetical protein
LSGDLKRTHPGDYLVNPFDSRFRLFANERAYLLEHFWEDRQVPEQVPESAKHLETCLRTPSDLAVIPVKQFVSTRTPMRNAVTASIVQI